MNKYVIFAFVVLLASCKGPSIAPEKPAAEYAPPKAMYDRQISYINIPMEISLADITKQVNKYMKGALYEDKSFEDNGGDGLKVLVKKYADIKVEGITNNILFTIPLDISGAYQTMGMTVNFKGVLKVAYVSAVTLKDNWKMETVTKTYSTEWIKSPAIDMGLFDLPVTYIADAALNGQKAYIEKEIDKAIREYVDLKSYLKEVIVGLYQPMLVSETYKTWFRLEPQEIYASQLFTYAGITKISLGMKTYTESFVGPKPPMGDTTKLPPMKVLDKMPDDFNVGLVAIVPYTAASELMTEQYVKTPYVYEDGKRKVTLNHFEIWGQSDKMVVDVGMEGSVNGHVFLMGIPAYDSVSRNIIMQNVDFHVDTKNKLLKSANWLLHGKFAKVMEKNLYFEIGKQLDASKVDAASYLNNWEYSKGIFLKGKLDQLETRKVFLTSEGIVCVMTASGKVGVRVEGME